MKYLYFLIFISLISFELRSQNLSIVTGTDVPYQHYIGATLQSKQVDISYRTGILVPPYSDAILGIIERLGTNEIYIDLLQPAYKFGWMNSLGGYFKFGKQKSWYAGPEFRFDYLTAADTPSDLLETLTGQIININTFFFGDTDIELGLKMYALGARLGKSFIFGGNNQYSFNLELSAYKHIKTQSTLRINNQEANSLNDIINDLLWEDVFKKNGYIGGLGVSFKYTL